MFEIDKTNWFKKYSSQIRMERKGKGRRPREKSQDYADENDWKDETQNRQRGKGK